MKKIKKEKIFDAVKMRRNIRDKISAETQHMNFDEMKVYMKDKIKEGKLKPLGQ